MLDSVKELGNLSLMSSVSFITLQRAVLPHVRVDPLALEKYVQAQGGLNKIKERVAFTTNLT